MINRRNVISLALVLAAALPAVARGDGKGNLVREIGTRSLGAKTVITLRGSATPSFTAYRLERPARVVVDLADGRFDTVEGPIDVDTWAVGQIAVSQQSDQHTRVARVMIGFKRPASYDVKAAGNDVVITITPDETPPAEQLRDENARAEEAKKGRLGEEARRKVAEGARQKAEREAESARRRADEEVVRLEAQRADAARKAGEARAEVERRQAELEAVRGQIAAAQIDQRSVGAQAEQATQAARTRMNATKAELERIEAQRSRLSLEKDAAAKQADAARAELGRAEAERAMAAKQAEAARGELSRIEAARQREQAALQATRAQVAEASRARGEEEAKLSAARGEAMRLSDEAIRLAAVQQETRRAAEQEAARLETTRREAQRVAAERAAEAQRLEAARAVRADVDRARAEAKRLADEASAARTEVERAREKLSALAAQQAADIERVNRQVAAARANAEQLQRARSEEEGKLDTARREVRKVNADRDVELKRLDEARREADRLGTLAATRGERLAAARRSETDAKRLSHEKAADLARIEALREQKAIEGERLDRLTAEKRSAPAGTPARQREVARLEAARAEAERLSKAREAELAQFEAARAEARRLADQRAAEVARLAELRSDGQRLSAARAATLSQLEAARAEAARMAAEQKAELLRLEAARSDRKQLAANGARLDAERADTEKRLASARAELLRFEKALAEAKAAPPAAAVATKARPLPGPGGDAATQKTVTSVDFQDRPDGVRVVVGVDGDPDFTVLRFGTTTTLRVKGAHLPARLARTLDTSAFHGPVSSVSTYVDPQDPGAVRVDVKLATEVEPDARKEAGRIVWDFPKGALSASYPPARVAGYGLNALPLQITDPNAQRGAPRPRAAAQLGGNKRFTGSHIDLDFKDADIHNILRLLADVGQVNIVTSDDVRGSVTIRMRDVPWDQALDVVLRAKGLGMARDRNLIRVAPQGVLDKELEVEIAQRAKEVELRPLTSRLLPLSYATATTIMPRVQDLLSPRGKVSVDERTNVLIVSDISGNIALAEDLVRRLDTQTPQVLIEARVVEARTSSAREFGIQWGGNGISSTATGNPTGLVFPSTVGIAGGAADGNTPVGGTQGPQAASPNYVVNMPSPVGTGAGGALGFTFGSVAGNFNINLRLSAAESSGSTRILSAPKITTMDNVEASIEQGTGIPVSTTSALGTQTQFIDASLKLTVKPHVTNEGSVVMKLDITRNEPDFSRLSSTGAPAILKRSARTEMLVRDGDTAVIGGIYSRNSATSIAKVPWLADIPILGWLFKQKREVDDRTELLIFITPRILNRAASVARQ